MFCCMQKLIDWQSKLKQRGIYMLLAAPSPQVVGIFDQSGLLQKLGKHIFEPFRFWTASCQTTAQLKFGGAGVFISTLGFQTRFWKLAEIALLQRPAFGIVAV